MNKIEELEERLHAVERLLGIETAIVPAQERQFWDIPTSSEQARLVPSKVVFKCKNGHQHDEVLEAKACQER